MDRLGPPFAGFIEPQPLGTAADQPAPQPSERRRADDAKQRPFVTSARLTVNSPRLATNSLVPSSGSIRKRLPRNGGFA